MPELPDLEIIKSFLNQRLVGTSIEKIEVVQPLVIRRPPVKDFIAGLQGRSFQEAQRRGKYLILQFDGDVALVIHLMLVGRLQYCPPSEKRNPATCFVFHFSNGFQLRYFDSKVMGRVYLVRKDEVRTVPGIGELGPEAWDKELTVELFRQRLAKYRGEIKTIITNQEFLAGIGNAYADEILFVAGIYPYRKRTELSADDVQRLYHAIRQVLLEATEILSNRVGDHIHVEIRDFLKVHGRGGLPCPNCGSNISQIIINQRTTEFCRHCQK